MRAFTYGVLIGLLIGLVLMGAFKCKMSAHTDLKAEKVVIDSLKDKRSENALKQIVIEKEIIQLPSKEKVKLVTKVIPQIVHVNDTVFQIDLAALDTINLMQSRIEFLKGDTANANAIIKHQGIVINTQDSLLKVPNKGFLKGFLFGFGSGYITGKVF